MLATKQMRGRRGGGAEQPAAHWEGWRSPFGTSCSGGCALGWPDSCNVASQLLAKMQIVLS
jgi:hypothetical protein